MAQKMEVQFLVKVVVSFHDEDEIAGIQDELYDAIQNRIDLQRNTPFDPAEIDEYGKTLSFEIERTLTNPAGK